MRRFLFVALAAGLLSPTAAIAESHWLILFIDRFGGTTSQKIEMRSSAACEKEGQRWNQTQRKSKSPYYFCVVGK